MKADLVRTEPVRLEAWKNLGLYQRILSAREGRPPFILHDGPPYANGNIHIGHALNKILKDFIVKSRSMMGYRVPYVPGWDCHGLPIEVQVDKKLGKRKATLSAVQIRREARQHAERFMASQAADFQRLGVLGDFDHRYATMDFQYQADIVRALGSFLADGSVYKGLRSVHWCIHCRTALAEAEIEYESHSSPSIYVIFPLLSKPERIDPALAGRRVSVIIWTTTPWTIPANMAIAFNPNFRYSAVAIGEEVFIVATELVDKVSEKLGWSRPVETLAMFEGTRLEGLSARHPFLDRESVFILADHVTLDAGTGAVHTAPGHGYEDYVIGQKYGLETYSPVDAAGRFEADVPFFAGMQVFDANGKITAHLRDAGMLLAEEVVEHSYPHCWRCHNPVIFRATPQWFISMDRKALRERALEAIELVNYYPGWGRERMRNVVKLRPDWCISRQRTWGVPITVFYCGECEEILASPEIIEHVARIFEKEGADVWYEREAGSLVPPGLTCSKCGRTEFRKETDILDVWLDSGTSSLAVLERRGLPWPADLYVEGPDQFRAWFNSSLMVGVVARGGAPYRSVVAHGWTVDAQGNKMSKSIGNVIEPQEVTKHHGAEILRLWVAASDYHDEVRISEEILSRLVDAYRKIRNTACYLLNNLSGFLPDRDLLPSDRMWEIDRWILAEWAEVARAVRGAYERYEFHLVYQTLYGFSAVELSAVYFDILKDRLYTSARHGEGRRSAQSALHHLLRGMTTLIAPILAFTADEIWTKIPGQDINRFPSVHVAEFEPTEPRWSDEPLLARWRRLMEIRREVTKALEEKRAAKLIGSSLEARVTLSASGDTFNFLEPFVPQLPSIFIVSQVDLRLSDQATLAVHIERAEGQKCERCWNYRTTVGESAQFPTICDRCLAVIAEIERERDLC